MEPKLSNNNRTVIEMVESLDCAIKSIRGMTMTLSEVLFGTPRDNSGEECRCEAPTYYGLADRLVEQEVMAGAVIEKLSSILDRLGVYTHHDERNR